MAPWHTSQWAEPPSARRLPVFDPHRHSGTANLLAANHDSDYHSMTSSQSNSTESLDQLLNAVTRTGFVEKLDFDRAISKPLSGQNTPIIHIPPSPSQVNDFLSTPQLTQLSALPPSGASERPYSIDDGCSRSCSSDDTPSTADEAAECKQRMYARRDSFNGLTDHSVRPKIGALFLNQQHQDFATPTTSTHNVPRTILRRLPTPTTSSVVLPNMSVPPPHYFPPPPTTELNTASDIPVFDATVPPPTFVPRSVLAAAAAAAAMQKPPPIVEQAKVELYRPREMRLTPQQNVQPPSSATVGSNSKPLQTNAPVFVPGSAPNRPTLAVSKIAAKFTEAPIVLPVQDYPALISPVPSARYIVKQTAETLYHTPAQSSASTAAAVACAQQSLASIVRTTLPKLMAQQKTPLATVESTKTAVRPQSDVPAAVPLAADDADHDDDGLGMSNVNGWLKSLRLHKYVWLFANMTYTQMLRIDDAYLERRQITKGARNKLALSVQKLRERYETLDRVEKELLTGSAQLSDALDELTAVAQSPMRPIQPFVVNDVATKLMKLVNMGKC